MLPKHRNVAYCGVYLFMLYEHTCLKITVCYRHCHCQKRNLCKQLKPIALGKQYEPTIVMVVDKTNKDCWD